MTRGLLLALVLLSSPARGQDVVLRDTTSGPAADIVRRVVAGPHAVRAGDGPLVLPRDSTVTTSLLVLGRPTYIASRVQGDVVVIGADLFLRPGVDISGRAVAIGGTVAETTLGRVAGGTESRRDESFVVRHDSAGATYALDYRNDRPEYHEPIFSLTGIYGLQLPVYDRVDGLSLALGALAQLQDHAVELAPTVTYRSRLGVVDPALTVRLNPLGGFGLDLLAARTTRTNERWIYGDLVNSAFVLFTGADTRNYFRSDIAEGRLVRRALVGSDSLSTFVGARYESISPITAAGNVWSFAGRKSIEKILRPNPLVESGHLASALVGANFQSGPGLVASRLSVLVEPSFSVPASAARFVQLTIDGRVDFPTFGTQALHVRAHGVATHGDSVPMARFAYLGGTGSLRTLDLLEEGGSALLYVENRYTIPLDKVVLPLGIVPVLSLRDAFGAAGVGSLPSLQHEIGAGIGVSALHFDVNRGVAGRKRTEFGVGISLSI